MVSHRESPRETEEQAKEMRFVVTGLPRCRTAWWAAYLTTDKVFCYHEADYMNSDWKIPYKYKGNSEAGVTDTFLEEFNPQKMVIVHRDVDEVYRSLEIIGQPVRPGFLEELEKRNEKLDGLHVDFYNIDLDEVHTYLEIPGYCPHRAKLFTDMNIQSKYWR